MKRNFPKAPTHKERNLIKRDLKKFAKQEFNQKKPKETRLLRLKPHVVFKKGAVLPSLLIKTLGKTSYVIYLDFGNEVRFYFFNHFGQSLGAKNYPKSKNMLSQLYGKATTLLKLPKIDPLAEVDQLSRQMQNQFQKKIQKTANQYNLPIPKIPTISALKKLSHPYSIRIGAQQQNHILHINQNLWLDPVKKFLIYRETFLSFINHKNPNEVQLFLATLWSLLNTPKAKSIIGDSLNKIAPKQTKLVQKSMEWLQKIIFPHILENSNLNQNLIDLIFNIALGTSTTLLDDHPFFWDLLLFWMITQKWNTLQTDYKITRFWDLKYKTSWIINKIFILLFEDKPILTKYDIDIHSNNLKQSWEFWWFFYLCHHYALKLKQYLDWKILPKKLPKNDLNPSNTEIVTFLQRLELLPALRITPIQIQQELSEQLHTLFENLFLMKCLEISFSDPNPLQRNDQILTTILLKNRGDWILEKTEYFIEWIPQNRIECNLNPVPKTTFFDTRAKIGLNIKTKAQTGEITIMLKCRYQSPFFSYKKSVLTLSRFQFQIQ